MGYRVERDVRVAMSDGVVLATDVWVPDGAPGPALLLRLPYGKSQLAAIGAPTVPNLFALLDAGYAVVIQDCRGTYASEGEFTPMVDEPADGAATIAWIRRQPWCDGAVAMFGTSYLGMTQWAAASRTPEGLTAIAPVMASTDSYRSPWYSPGGAMSWGMVATWGTTMALMAGVRDLTNGGGDLETLMHVVGLRGDPEMLNSTPGDHEVLAGAAPWLATWWEHPDRDGYWNELAVAGDARCVAVPALHIAGWFDIFVDDATRTFARMRAGAGSPEAREGQRLIIGPWDHGSQTGVYADRRFGIGADIASVDITSVHLQFFDRWVRGNTDALAGAAPVRIFVMGIDQWRDEQDWPLPDTTYVDYYLDGGGRANTSHGNGALSPAAPTQSATETFRYDPADPVPTLGGRMMLPVALNAAGPVDQRAVEERADVLVFTTPPLEEQLEVTGHVSLVLHVASSALDTDFTGKLVDVHPDGRVLYLTDGILRARYRGGLDRPEPLEPEQVYAITVDLSVTSNVFLPGHRIRLEVSSSNFPRYDRNTNTGGAIAQESLDAARPAVNRVLHGPDHPSRLVLPVIAR